MILVFVPAVYATMLWFPRLVGRIRIIRALGRGLVANVPSRASAVLLSLLVPLIMTMAGLLNSDGVSVRVSVFVVLVLLFVSCSCRIRLRLPCIRVIIESMV